MRINTDGVLLAAMAEAENPSSILDIGTGTGVIALMLAQRFVKANVHAVEIDAAASATAGRNFTNSNFAERLQVSHLPIQEFEPLEKFDLIVSNPPFFVNDLKNAEKKKEIARHADELFFDALVAKVASLLTENGSFWFILPLKQAADVIEKAINYQFAVEKEIYLHSDENKPAFRVIVGLSRRKKPAQQSKLFIYKSEKVYTDAYRLLLKDFFLGY